MLEFQKVLFLIKGICQGNSGNKPSERQCVGFDYVHHRINMILILQQPSKSSHFLHSSHFDFLPMISLNYRISHYLNISHYLKISMLLDDEIDIEGISYQICGEIGEGGVGHVYVIKDNKHKYALKVIKDYGRNPILKEMVNQEITFQQKFKDNPHIIQIYANKQLNKRMHIIFELGTCSLRNRMNMESHIELNQFIDITLDVTKGLTAIHSRSLIHRDIKPQNIICVERTYKITDFGSLHQGQSGDARIGTPLYLPPEMLFDDESEYDQRVDVWSLGVSLFQAYFRIHPFYYGKDITNVKLVYQQLKRNIKKLTPDFTFQRFLDHLQDQEKYREECESIRNKILVTPKEILQQFTCFFQHGKDRPEIQYFAAVFQSLEESVRDSVVKKSRLLSKIQEIPSDIKFYIDTLNTFYDLCSRYGNQKKKQIEFHLQLAMWYWNYFNYLGQKYVEYNQVERLRLYKKEKEVLWKEVQTALFDYWLELSSNSELTFFSDLQMLKVRVLICGARYKIYKNLESFVKKIQEKVGMEVENLQTLEKLLSIFEVIQVKRIQEILVNEYYYN